jgi:hypothetical protein
MQEENALGTTFFASTVAHLTAARLPAFAMQLSGVVPTVCSLVFFRSVFASPIRPLFFQAA